MIQIKDDTSVIDPTLQTLKKTFITHKTRSIAFRKQQLQNMLKGIQELEEKFHEALNKDVKASKFHSQIFSTKISALEVEDTLKNFEKWVKPRDKETQLLVGPAKSFLMPEPLGVALVISAWNYPIYTALPPVAQAISAGNCVILKPSELAPNSSKVLVELFEKYIVIEGAVEVSSTITSYPFDLIIFTGSPEKGRLVAMAAAKNLTPCILELGGKSPTIVDKDVHMDSALLRIGQGRFINSGQTCVAVDYVFVHKAVAKEFIARMKDTLRNFFGEDASKCPDFIKIVNQNHAERIKGYITEDHGGQVVYGGKYNTEERYIEPTIIVNPRFDSKVMTEEIFGPVLPIIEFEDIDFVIKFINERPKPLALYYFGSTYNVNKEKLMNQTSSGAFAVNEACFHLLNPHIPFGGVGNSGMGSYHGIYGFDNCSHLKPVFNKLTINSFPFSTRFPPYTNFKQKVLLFLFGYMAIDQGKALKGVSYLSVMTAGVILYKKGKIDGHLEYIREFMNKLTKL